MTATHPATTGSFVDAPVLPGVDDALLAAGGDTREHAVARLSSERRARARARRRAQEHLRARRRVERGRFAAHPGWRHRRVEYRPRTDQGGRLIRGADPVIHAAPDGQVVILDQAWAQLRVTERIDTEALWRTDRHDTAAAVLQALVHGMDWTTGLVAGVTRRHLAQAAGCSVRTVSRVLAWATSNEIGLLVCVEPGATAEHLGTETNRAPAYAFVASAAEAHALSQPATDPVVDEDGNPPASCVARSTPRRDQGKRSLDKKEPAPEWGLWDRPRTPGERAAATERFLARTGMTGVVRWRAIGLLGRWWSDPRICVAGLLHVLDHHPDRPDETRGDALRGARDPLAVLAARLAPWQGRLGELPPSLVAVDPDERRRRAARQEADHQSRARTRSHRPTSSPAVREAARRVAFGRSQPPETKR